MRIRRFSRKKISRIIKEPRLMQFRNQSNLLKASEIARTKKPQTVQETDNEASLLERKAEKDI